jgi:tRNA (guanine6-N2)-methyltransferase
MSAPPARERVFLLATRGLEDLVAEEFAERAGGAVAGVGYRRVSGCADPAAVVALRLPEDAFLELAHWDGVGHTRAALADIGARAAALPLERGLARLRALRALPARPRLAIAVSHVGARNYSAPEVRAACARALAGAVEPVERDDDADCAARLFLEHDRAWVGLRIARAPLHERAWTRHRPGALRASVAAAIARWAHAHAPATRPGAPWIADPCCGGGTILIEARRLRAGVLGGDLEARALTDADAAVRAAREVGEIPADGLALWRADAARLPLGSRALAALASNLPWGRQVGPPEAAALTSAIGAEARRVLAPGGCAALLTTLPDALALEGAERRELSVSGQRPTLVLWRQAR